MKLKLFLLPAILLLLHVAGKAQEKPNIILILSDDAGYADFGFQGSRFIATPNIDKIANEGVKFTNAYVSGAVCSPSRAGLLTGINQPEFGHVGNFIQGVQYNIPKEEYGIPSDVQLVGDYLKPLGYRTGIVGKWHEGFAERYQPNSRGFDYFWGFLWGSSQYFNGRANGVIENGTPVSPNDIPYMTDAITDQSLAFIDREKEHPFFLYISYNAVHTPQQAKNEDIALFKDRFKSKKRLMNAAMTHSLDQNVGRIIDHLKELGLLENTLIVFTNDNGGQTETLDADNYPLRGLKGDIYEGGIRVPMAIRWPGKINPHTVINTPVSSLDFVPTFIEAAGGKIENHKQLKGLDLLRVIKHPQSYNNRTLYWRTSRDVGAIRKGDWKLVYFKDMRPELYNLATDIGETENVYSQERKKAKTLEMEFKNWFDSLPEMRFYPLNKDAAE